MKIMIKKLNSKRGASIIIALMIFLLCALAGASAFIMASANVGRYAHSQDNRQVYYSVTSAALTIVDLIDGMVYTSDTVNYDYTRKWTYDADNKEHVQSEEYTISIPEKGKGKLSDVSSKMLESNIMKNVSEYCDLLVPYLYIPQEWYSTLKNKPTVESMKPENKLNIKFKIAPDAGNAGVVECILMMNYNYDLLFSFSCLSGDTTLYSVNLYWVAEVEDPISAKQPEYDYTDDRKSGSMHIRQTKTVTVKWSKKNVTLSRGEASSNVED